jgi:hypothetical protein
VLRLLWLVCGVQVVQVRLLILALPH